MPCSTLYWRPAMAGRGHVSVSVLWPASLGSLRRKCGIGKLLALTAATIRGTRFACWALVFAQGGGTSLNGKSTMFSKSLILVAGGEAADRETILQALNDEFHVVAAQTMEDALAHAKDSIGLVICDLESAQVQGMELVRRWKAQQPQTPFLALTRDGDVATAVEAMKHGVADCLVEPIDQDDLRSTAMQLVNENGDEISKGNGNDAKARTKAHVDIPPGTSLEDLERAAVEQ